jgi:hypothetical protein
MKTLAASFAQPRETGVPAGSSWHSCFPQSDGDVSTQRRLVGLRASTLSAIAKKASFASAQP